MRLLPLIPIALALVVLAVLGHTGIGPLTDERRARRSGPFGAVGPAIALLDSGACIALAVIGVVAVVGLGGGDGAGDSQRGDARVATSVFERSRIDGTAATTTTTAPEGPRAPSLGPEVTVEAEEGETFPASYEVADGLDHDTVLRMHVLGFEPFARAVAEQCAPSASRNCDNEIPVQFDADGEARFEYLISAELLGSRAEPGGCGAGTAPCTIVVRALDGQKRGTIQTIFGDEVPPPGRIAVSRSKELSLDGETVTVQVRGYRPGVEVTAMVCAAPDATGPRCGAPGPTAPLVVGRDGTGRTQLDITPGRVGHELAPCRRGDDCGISVASEDVFARAPVVPITFAAPPGPAYDPTRLALGAGVATLLIATSAALLLRTDWAPVGEVAAPEIDNAEYADLDAIIAALPPEEDDPVPPLG